MKNVFSLLTIAVFAFLISCNSNNKANSEEIYEYVEESAELNEQLSKRVGDWIEEGLTCYGILAIIDGNGVMQEGQVIKAKVIRIKSDSIKMKSLEDINLREVEGCNKLGISNGETWWETEGDLFKTMEEAEDFLTKALLEAQLK
ncbi:MAG: hypothetical protein K9H49_14090 [Bacteroidales bacterium]|nr:hypothetical protein [Bacteroidales bacterium]MCF8390824.1 hypothetical protein [Bacteroidales bacterium]